MEHFDLYQLHAVNTFAELDAATALGGALEALVEARRSGLIRFLGITGHGLDAPAIFMEALRRFDFDTILFPINFVLYANPVYRRQAGELLTLCKARDVGVMVIKTVARSGGDKKQHTYLYQPSPIRPSATGSIFACPQFTVLYGATRDFPCNPACQRFYAPRQTGRLLLRRPTTTLCT